MTFHKHDQHKMLKVAVTQHKPFLSRVREARGAHLCLNTKCSTRTIQGNGADTFIGIYIIAESFC